MLVALTGAYSVFVLFLYTPLNSQEMWLLAPIQAAWSRVAIALGLSVGLLVGGLSTRESDVGVGNVAIPMQIFVGCLALVVLAVVEVGFPLGCALLFLAAFGTAVPLHLPTYVCGDWFPDEKRAFHGGVLHGCAMCFNACISAGFGHIRMDARTNKIFVVAAGGLLISCIAVFFLMRARKLNAKISAQLQQRKEEREKAALLNQQRWKQSR
jgi:hypothetical protein